MSFFKGLAAGALLLLLGACSSAGPQPTAPTPTAGDMQFRSVLSAGYAAIRERYLYELSVADIAGESLRGLSSLDPAVSIDRSSSRRLTLLYRDRAIFSYPAPDRDDVTGWTTLVATFTHAAADISPDIAKANAEQLYESLFDAALAKLDVFSHYAGRMEARSRRTARNGFGGIGIHYRPESSDIALTEIIPETPADKAGLRIGDRIAQIDGHPVAGLPDDAITRLFQGTVDSPVSLLVREINRQHASLKVITLRRALIPPSTVHLRIMEGLAVLRISGFSEGTARMARDELAKAKKKHALAGVILDLRGNPGGLLDQGVAVADLFIAHGRIVSTRGRNTASFQIFDARPGDIGEKLPLAVLIDGETASAAEIVTAALQDTGRAVVIGSNSFGKGTVQTIVRLPNDGEMTLTWSRYFSPSDYALHGLGVLPDLCTVKVRDISPSKRLKAVLAERHAEHLYAAAWRKVEVDDQIARKQLRDLCPATPANADDRADLELAELVLRTPRLYREITETAPEYTKPIIR